MAVLSGFSYVELRFTREGEVLEAADRDTVLRTVREAPGLTDLLVLSHGWNNDMKEARVLYAKLAARLATEFAGQGGWADRRIAILGVLWPSKRFADRDLIPGGAASAVGSTLDTTALREQLALLRGVLNTDLEEDSEAGAEVAAAASVGSGPAGDDLPLQGLEDLLPRLEDSPKARREFADRVRAVLPRDSADEEDASDAFFATEPGDLMDRLGGPLLTPLIQAPAGTGGAMGGTASLGTSGGAPTAATGGAVGIGDTLTGARAAARRLLNYATYYVMKARAGRVGRRGLADVLQRIRRERPDLMLHLAGHSFGARVATSAVAAATLDPPVASLTLLQAAFSHNGFAVPQGKRPEGAFRRVLNERKVSGPIVITHTRNDQAVGLAYPLASRIAQQNNSGIGDRSDPYGGLGRNGAIFTPEAVDEFLLCATAPYSFSAGTVHNLVSDDFISDHGAVTGPEVGHALMAAMSARW
ncbi:hypothetical protein [Geodermatophilus sp. URMC 62]|uniref:hypothetical protein n=1 Tax=Geodermatophilus sp. URMC 62 TaxID=3423414 RepID=UPI00406CC8EC